MTVQTNTNVATGIGNGVTSVFPVGFKFNSAEDLVVNVIDEAAQTETLLTLDSDYTVDGAGDENGGSISLLAGPLAVGKSVVTKRVVAVLQLTDLRNQGKFFAEVHEDTFDKSVMIDQQQQEQIDRSMIQDILGRWNAFGRQIINVGAPVQDGDATRKDYVDTGDQASREYADAQAAYNFERTLRVPDPISQIGDSASRANKLLSFDATGNPVATAPDAQSATALAIALANSVIPVEGANKVGFNGGTVRDRLIRSENSLVSLLASGQEYSEGTEIATIREGYSYLVASPGASDQDLTTAGGAKLYVLPSEDGLVRPKQFNATTPSAIAALIESGKVTSLEAAISAASGNIRFRATTNAEYSRFSVNGVKFLSRPIGLYAKVPADFAVKPKFAARLVNFGTVETSFDVASLRTDRVFTSVKHYYIDPIIGTSGGAGTEADPMDTPARASLTEAGSPSAQTALMFHIRPGKYDADGTLWKYADGLVKSYGVVPWGDDPRDIEMIQGWYGNSRTWTDQTGGVWSSPVSAVSAVFDELIRNDMGDASFYSKVATVGALVSGSWAQSGSTLYVKTLDGRQPDTSVGIARAIQNKLNNAGASSQQVYIERVKFAGSVGGAQFGASSAALDLRLYTKNCTFMYSGANGLWCYGHSLVISQNGRAAYNLSDGFNYHSETGTLTKAGLGIEINCKSYRNGYSWSPSQNINNGSTCHDNCIMMRYGTTCFENRGPNIADVNNTKSYNFGCLSFDSLRDGTGADSCDYDFSGAGVLGWMDCCRAKQGSSAYSVTTYTPVKVRECDIFPAVYNAEFLSPYA